MPRIPGLRNPFPWARLHLATVLLAGCTDCSDSSNTLTISLAGSGSGKVVVDGIEECRPGPCSYVYTDRGGPTSSTREVQLQATADQGSVFLDWSGSVCSGSLSEIRIQLETDRACEATFNLAPPPPPPPPPPGGTRVTVFQDAFDDITDPFARWDTTYAPTGAGSATVNNPSTGGVPAGGGYRRGSHVFVGAGTVSVTHLFKSPFDPAAPNGPVTRIDVAMDRILDPASSPGAGVGTLFVVHQNGVQYQASMDVNNVHSNRTWQRVTKSFTAADFNPAPGPNFAAGVMRVGFVRSNTAGGAVTVIWGVDNWKVEIYH